MWIMTTILESREAINNAGGSNFFGVQRVVVGCSTIERTWEMRKMDSNTCYCFQKLHNEKEGEEGKNGIWGRSWI